jgi:chromosome partitioning protein
MPQVIAVAQAKGGCGKTTLAVCLAGYWAAQGERVCMIDADPQQHAAKWIQNGNGVLTSIRLITLPRDLPQEMAGTDGDRVLVDLIGADADVLTLAVANADLVLIPVQDSPLDIDGALVTYRRMKQAEKARGAAIPYRIVLTRTQPQTSLYAAVVRQLKEAGLAVAGAELRNRVGYKEGMMTGMTPSLGRKNAAATEIAQLAREVEALARETA